MHLNELSRWEILRSQFSQVPIEVPRIRFFCNVRGYIHPIISDQNLATWISISSLFSSRFSLSISFSLSFHACPCTPECKTVNYCRRSKSHAIVGKSKFHQNGLNCLSDIKKYWHLGNHYPLCNTWAGKSGLRATADQTSGPVSVLVLAVGHITGMGGGF